MNRRYRRLVQALLLLALIAGDLGRAGAAEQLAPYTGRWIDVNLTKLTITAYDGAKAVYSAPVTTGKKGFATPTGTFSVLYRVRKQDMESQPNDPEHYLVKDVEYVQYFRYGGFAIHANYWQPASVFGRVNTSHGCVGMQLKHAAYFWSFAGVGTPITIHYGASSGAPPVVKVESVVGQSRDSAKASLQGDGLKTSVRSVTTMNTDAGIIVEQKPAAGRLLPRGSTVTLTVTEARVPAPVRPPEGAWSWAPDVVGLTEAEALARIEQSGLKATYVNYFDENGVSESLKKAVLAVRPGAVFGTLTGVGERIPRGSDFMIAIRRG